ncbi:hypothetical protein D3C77_707620 [compost metagenome]
MHKEPSNGTENDRSVRSRVIWSRASQDKKRPKRILARQVLAFSFLLDYWHLLEGCPVKEIDWYLFDERPDI